MEKKLFKQTTAAVLLTSSLLSFSPAAYGETKTIQQSIDAVKLELKKAPTYYVHPAINGEVVSSSALYPVLNNVKKNYEETKKALKASNLSEEEKQKKLNEIDALYQEKITKGLVPYIDAFNYAAKYLDPLLAKIKEAEAKNDFAAVEKAYHALSYQLKERTTILYRFAGKASRDLLLDKYKQPANEKRDELVIPVSIYMKVTEAEKLLSEGKTEEAKKIMESVKELVEKLPGTATSSFVNALVKEVDSTRKDIGLPPLTPPVNPVITPPLFGGGGGGGGTPSETSVERELRLAKADALTQLANFKVATDYSTANWNQISALKTVGANAINAATTTVEVTNALTSAKAEIDKVKTAAEELAVALTEAKNNAKKDLANYLTSENYSEENWTKIEEIKAKGVNAIEASTTIADVADIVVNVKEDIKKIKTKEQENLEKITANVSDVEGLIAALENTEKSIINLQSDIELSIAIKINREITFNGGGNTIKVVYDLGDNNSAKHALGIEKDNVTIKDLIIDNDLKAYGIQAYGVNNTKFENVTIKNSKGAGLTVNGSTVAAINLNTKGNTWGAVNVDPGLGVETPSVFTLTGNGELSELTKIWSDGKNVNEKASIQVNAAGHNKVVSSEGKLQLWTNNDVFPNLVTIKSEDKITAYPTIQEAVNSVEEGGIINIGAGTYKLLKQLKITKPVEIVGTGDVVIEPASEFDKGTYNPDLNLILIDNVKDMVKLENLTITNSLRSGINVFESTDVKLNKINSINNTAAGLIVTNSQVIADNFNTSGNGWYGVNVDNGSNPSSDALKSIFTLNNGILSETTQIITDKGDVTVNANGYTEYKVDSTTKIIWSNHASTKGVFIEGSNTLYTSIQAAVDASEAGATIKVGSGTYELTNQLKITKPINIIGVDGTVIKASNDFVNSTHNPDNNLISIIGVNGTVQLDNLTVSNSKRSGINVFESTDVHLNNIYSIDNAAAGLIVANSKVVANNFSTSGNGWYGVNVDNGSKPSSEAPLTSFTLNSGTISENTQIISDKGGVEVHAPSYSVIINDSSILNNANITSWYPEPTNHLLDTSVNINFDKFNITDIDSIKFSLYDKNMLLGTRISTGANLQNLLRDAAQYWGQTEETYADTKGVRILSSAFKNRTEEEDNGFWVSSITTALNETVPDGLFVEVKVGNVIYIAKK